MKILVTGGAGYIGSHTDNCWIAGNVTITAGAKIGNGCVIGAGSVVTGTIPDNTLAYGVPCRAVRQITEADRLEFKKELF